MHPRTLVAFRKELQFFYVGEKKKKGKQTKKNQNVLLTNTVLYQMHPFH